MTKNKLVLITMVVLVVITVFLSCIIFVLIKSKNKDTKLANKEKPTLVSYLKNAGKSEDLYKKASKLFKEERFDEALKLYQDITIDFKDTPLVADAWYKIAQIYQKKNLTLAARDAYKTVVINFPSFSNIADAQAKLGDLNVRLLFSFAQIPESTFYTVSPGDTLVKIAKKFNTTAELIKKSNNIKSDGIIHPSMRLKVPKNLKFSVVVNKTQNILILKANEQVFKVYKVATGQKGSTPIGSFKIVNKLIDPVWFKEGARVENNSPANILGSRWMGISEPGYGIHGTTDPSSIGKQSTAGCIRMLNSEVEELYDILPIGADVTILD